jgi:hypothetical protein
LLIGDDEFRLIGALSKKGMITIKKAAFEESLAGTWNAEKRVLSLLAEYMPKVRVKKIIE